MLDRFRGMFGFKGDAQPQAQQQETENPLEGISKNKLMKPRTLDNWMDYFEELVGHTVLYNRHALSNSGGDLESSNKLSLKDFLTLYGKASKRETMTHSEKEGYVVRGLWNLIKED